MSKTDEFRSFLRSCGVVCDGNYSLKKRTGFRPRKVAEASRKDVLRGRLRKGMLVKYSG